MDYVCRRRQLDRAVKRSADVNDRFPPIAAISAVVAAFDPKLPLGVAPWQLQMEHRSTLLALRRPQTPAMLLDNGSAKRQAQAGSGLLGREKGVENPGHLIGQDSAPGITDLE